MILLLTGLFLITVVLGVPFSFAIGFTTLTYFVLRPEFPMLHLAQKTFAGLDSFTLLAVPFFLLAGSLMNRGGVTQRLVDFATALVGHIAGGLGNVVVLVNVIMAGMSGSATADASATGAILIPAMNRAGYPPAFGTALVASASTIGPIIPPSIPMVLLGGIAGISIGRLFLGGIVPGLLMGIYLMAAVYIISKRRRFPTTERIPLKRLVWVTWRAIPVLAMPAVILGGMYTGLFTATEAAVVAVAYAFVLGVAYRELDPSGLWAVGREVVLTNAVVMLILGVFNVASWILTIEELPQLVLKSFTAFTDNPLVALLIINIVLLLLGILLEPIPLLIMTAPFLMPVIRHYGIDPVHFGVVYTLNLMLGLITPPVGMNIFITCQIGKVSVAAFTRELWPFFVALVVVLLVITYIPGTVTFIPNLLMGRAR
jgi:C4-dicarboxylate transporter, DctM subunit